MPIFDLETGARSGLKEIEVSEECGVVYVHRICVFTKFLQLRNVNPKKKDSDLDVLQLTADFKS